MNMTRSEDAMKKTFFALCLICFAVSAVLGQRAPTNRQPQNKPAQGADAAGKTPPQTGTIPNKPVPAPTGGGVQVPDDFIIGAEDVLEITVWREPELTSKAIVRPDGKIGMTLLGDVQASGLTTTQLKANIAKDLARFVEGPEVSVVVTEIHSQTVHLIGQVGRQGAYQLGGPLTVVELLARAGGLAETAKSDQIAIVRSNNGVVQRIPFNYKAYLEGRDLMHNILLKNGDVVIVK
jgi:polysaccharide export outer membrane protein